MGSDRRFCHLYGSSSPDPTRSTIIVEAPLCGAVVQGSYGSQQPAQEENTPAADAGAVLSGTVSDIAAGYSTQESYSMAEINWMRRNRAAQQIREDGSLLGARVHDGCPGPTSWQASPQRSGTQSSSLSYNPATAVRPRAEGRLKYSRSVRPSVTPFWKLKPIHPNLHAIPQSPTLRISETSAALKRQGARVFRFGLGQSPFPVMQPMVDRLREFAPHKDYLPTAGLLALREAIASFAAQRTGNKYAADDVLVGPGTKELIFLLQLCLNADLVLPSPSWVTYQPQSAMLGRRALWIETSLEDQWKLHPEVIDEALRAHAQYSYAYPTLLVLNYPSNPTGASYTPSELEALADVCRYHGVMVLSDEIYGRLTFHGELPFDTSEGSVPGSKRRFTRTHRSISEYYPEGTIILDGVSKWAGAGGWRVGAFIFPHEMAWLRDTMIAAASETYSSVSAPMQYASMAAFTEDTAAFRRQYLDSANHILHLVSSYCVDKLRNGGARVAHPYGGFYLFPILDDAPGVHKMVRARYTRETGNPPDTMTSTWLAEDLLKQTGVAALPGTAFGRLPEELSMRLAYVDFDGARALEAVGEGGPFRGIPSSYLGAASDHPVGKEQEDFLREYCGPVFEGMQRFEHYLLHGVGPDELA